MLVLASVLLIGFVAYHVIAAIYTFQSRPMLPISLGLIGLGVMNSVAGLGAIVAGFALGSLVACIGLISIDLGFFLDDLVDVPGWNTHAVRIGVTVFVAGLLIVAALE